MTTEHQPDQFKVLGPDTATGRLSGCVVFAPIIGNFNLSPIELREL